MPLLAQKALGTLVRHGLTALGAYLIAQGWVTNEDWTKAAEALAPIVGAIGWGLYQKYGSTLMHEALRALPAGASRTEAKADLAQMSLGEKLATATSAPAI